MTVIPRIGKTARVIDILLVRPRIEFRYGRDSMAPQYQAGLPTRAGRRDRRETLRRYVSLCSGQSSSALGLNFLTTSAWTLGGVRSSWLYSMEYEPAPPLIDLS